MVTDHNPLIWLRQQKDPRNKFARWLLGLESYDYTIEYRRGVDNGAADFLSRLPARRDEKVEEEEEHLERFIYLLDEITPVRDRLMAEQCKEPDIRRAIEQLNEGKKITSGPYRKQEGMRLDRDGRLCKRQAVVVLRVLEKEVTAIAHILSHAGARRSLNYIREKFFWMQMRKTIEDYCLACDLCGK